MLCGYVEPAGCEVWAVDMQRFRSLDRGIWKNDKSIYIGVLRFVLFCVGICHCNELVTLSRESNLVWLCLFVWVSEWVFVFLSPIFFDLGSRIKRSTSPEFGGSPTEGNHTFTYRHSNCSPSLLSGLRQSGCFSPLGHFIGHISEWAFCVEDINIFIENWLVR
jgi:hypothetical protein